MTNSLSRSLSWQLLTSILSVYFIITFLVTLVQMGTEYFHTRDTIADELSVFEKTFSPALTTALWELNSGQLKSIYQGIVDLPTISSVQIISAQGNTLVGDVITSHSTTALYHRFPIYYQFSGETIYLAEVIFETRGELVLARLEVGFKMILVSALIKSTALTLLFLLVFRRQLANPLKSLKNAVSSIDLDSLSQLNRLDLQQKQVNELTELQSAFNQMLDRLEKERIVHYSQLEQVNANLEQQVFERTQALQQANQRLEQLASSDSLTGLANRRHFVEQIQIAIHRAQREMTPLCLLMIDLDLFKNINDTYGHDVGDGVLKNFTQVAKKPLRATDLCARIGGEEFVILLPNTALESALQVAERVLQSVREQSIPIAQGTLTYSVSIGVSSLLPTETSYEAILKRADKALYRAKLEGRNRISIEHIATT